MDKDDTIVDGTILEESDNEAASNSTSDTPADQSATFLSLEELIKNHIESVAKMRSELKTQREMFEDSFNNNPTYREHTEKVKEANKAKASVKKQISSQPSVALLAQKVKDLRFDINESNQTLSELLRDYREQTGATQIETRDGQIMEIVSTVKLVKMGTKSNA